MDCYNVKVGDIFYVVVDVNYAWSDRKSFWLPKPVERISPKQFVVNGKHYRKQDGSLVGYGYGVKNLGDVLSNNIKVTDQTKEYHDFRKLIVLKNRIEKCMRVNVSIYAKLEDVTEAYAHIMKVRELLCVKGEEL